MAVLVPGVGQVVGCLRVGVVPKPVRHVLGVRVLGVSTSLGRGVLGLLAMLPPSLPMADLIGCLWAYAGVVALLQAACDGNFMPLAKRKNVVYTSQRPYVC